MRARVLGVLLVTLAAGCTPSSQPERASQTERPQRDRVAKAVLDEVESTWAKLADVQATCTDACCLDGMLDLAARQRALRRLDEAQVDEALRAIARGPHDAGVRAVAIAWLSLSNNTQDLDLFERFVDETDPVWPRPHSNMAMSQRSTLCTEHTVDAWEDQTLGTVALDAIGHLLGRQRMSRERYEAWRSEHPDALDSITLWNARLPMNDDAACRRTLEAIAAHDVDVLLRINVARSVPDSQTGCRITAHTAALLQRHGAPGRLVDALRNPDAWTVDPDPKHRAETSWARYARWVLSNASELMSRDDVDALVRLHASGPVHEDEQLRCFAALAVDALDPRTGRALIEQTGAVVREPPPAFARRYATLFPSAQPIDGWLVERSETTCSREPLAVGTVEGLAAAGSAGQRSLQAWAMDPARRLWDRPQVLLALADAAVLAGASSRRFSCRDDFHGATCRKVTRQTRARLQAEQEQAIETCLVELERWYGGKP